MVALTDYKSIFSARGEAYVEATRRWPGIRAQEFARMARLLALAGHEAVLDAPAGNGILASFLPDSVRYQALDPSPFFCRACESAGLAVQQAELHRSGFAEGTFDAVASLTGLHHVDDRASIYREWHRILRPGGRLVAMDVGAGSAVGGFLNGFVDRHNSLGHDGAFLDAEDEQQLREAGFVEVTCVEQRYCWVAGSEAELAEFMTLLFGLDRLPGEHATLAELERTLGLCRQPYGVAVNWTLMALLARKPPLG